MAHHGHGGLGGGDCSGGRYKSCRSRHHFQVVSRHWLDGVRWNNLNLGSPDAGTTVEDQITGLIRRQVTDLENGTTQRNLNQSDQKMMILPDKLEVALERLNYLMTG
jgi:hypothetical protein